MSKLGIWSWGIGENTYCANVTRRCKNVVNFSQIQIMQNLCDFCFNKILFIQDVWEEIIEGIVCNESSNIFLYIICVGKKL